MVLTLTKQEKAFRKEQRRIEKWNETHIIVDEVDYKKCSECNQYLVANNENFYSSKSNSIDGLTAYCIQCTKERASKWVKDNPDKAKEQNKRKVISNRPKRLEHSRRFGKTEQSKKYQSEWRKNNKNKIRDYSIVRRNKKHQISEDEWETCLEYFDWSCAYCGLSFNDHVQSEGQQLHKEHVIHDGNDFIDNCVPACKGCNTSKHDKEFNEWYNEDNPRYTKERMNKIVQWVTQDWMKWTE